MVYSDHVVVHSKSGNTYFITRTLTGSITCGCKGFGYREQCRHTEHAINVLNFKPTTSTPELPSMNDTQQAILDQLTKPRSHS